MQLYSSAVHDALAKLSTAELRVVFNSNSVRDARTAVTKFSTHLVASAARQADSGELVLHASFTGGKGGQSGGEAGRLTAELAASARAATDRHKMRYDPSSFLVDFAVTRQDVLDLVVVAESEARPLAPSTGCNDFDKLLAVGAPWRVFVGRVNVTATGKVHKVEAAYELLRQRVEAAISNGLV